MNQARSTNIFEKKDFGDKKLWAYKEKRGNEELLVYIPLEIREELAHWYHDNLRHPGAERLQVTMKQNFKWSGMSKLIEAFKKS